MRHAAILLATFAIGAFAATPDLTLEATPERLSRGEYLVNNVVDCAGCHSQRDVGKFNVPPLPAHRHGGGLLFRNVCDTCFTPNITPYALADWTDAEFLAAVTEGVRPDGSKLGANMPYLAFAQFDREDIYSIIVYLRSIPPVAGGPYPRNFPTDYVPNFVPTGPMRRPDDDAPEVERGAYLVGIAGCNGCHIGPPGSAVAGVALAGGREFAFPGRGLHRAANLTPDVRSGIGAWTREAFVARFKAMGSPAVQDGAWKPGEPTSVMPWWFYAGMTDRDLGAMWAYLTTVPAVEHMVVKWEPLPGTMQVINWIDGAGAATATR